MFLDKKYTGFCIGGSGFLWKKKGIKKGLGFGKKNGYSAV